MENEFLKELTLIENQIRTALEEKNFLKVSQLSKAFDEQIKKLTHQLQSQPDVSQTDITLLKELTVKLIAIENETIKQFRNFSRETSTKTKMHNAYKNYGG